MQLDVKYVKLDDRVRFKFQYDGVDQIKAEFRVTPNQAQWLADQITNELNYRKYVVKR